MGHPSGIETEDFCRARRRAEDAKCARGVGSFRIMARVDGMVKLA